MVLSDRIFIHFGAYFACNSAMAISFSPTVTSSLRYLFRVPSNLQTRKNEISKLLSIFLLLLQIIANISVVLINNAINTTSKIS